MSDAPDDPTELLAIFNAAQDANACPPGYRFASPSECAVFGHSPPLSYSLAARAKMLAGVRLLLFSHNAAGCDLWQEQALILASAQEAEAKERRLAEMKARGESEPVVVERATEGVSRFTMHVTGPGDDRPEPPPFTPAGNRVVRC